MLQSAADLLLCTAHPAPYKNCPVFPPKLNPPFLKINFFLISEKTFPHIKYIVAKKPFFQCAVSHLNCADSSGLCRFFAFLQHPLEILHKKKETLHIFFTDSQYNEVISKSYLQLLVWIKIISGGFYEQLRILFTDLFRIW